MKLTRKSYKRKIIAIGVAMFVSLALIATGFASWVLATAGQKEAEGNITVGTTTEKAIEISDIDFADGKNDFIFEPKADDLSGRVRYDGENAENLSVTIHCTITSASFAKEISVGFAALPAGIQKAVDEGYIVAPELNITIDTTNGLETQSGEINLSNGEAGGGNWTYEKVQSGENSDVARLSVTVKFAWGEKFEGLNPSIYFDNDEGRLAYPELSAVRDVLDTFKATIHEMTLDEYRAECFDPSTNEPIESKIDALESPKYKIIVSASA